LQNTPSRTSSPNHSILGAILCQYAEAADSQHANGIDEEGSAPPKLLAGNLSEEDPSEVGTRYRIIPAAGSSSGPTPSVLTEANLGFINSPFAQYDEMMQDIQRRCPPLTMTFLPRKEIPWPILPKDGVFPVELEEGRITVEAVQGFVIECSAWEGQPLVTTSNKLRDQWMTMHNRIKAAGCAPGMGKLTSNDGDAQTYRWIKKVRSAFFEIAEAQNIHPSEHFTFQVLPSHSISR
jgi:hypothetical protein